MSHATCDVTVTSDVVLVCIADDDLRRDVTATLRSEWPVRTAYDESAARASLDESVSVLLLDLADDTFDIDQTLDRQDEDGIAFETAALVDRHARTDERLDGYVHKPVSTDELRATVDRLHRRVQYDRLLGRYYSIATEYAETASARQQDPPELTRLRERLFTLRTRLDDIADGLDDADAFDAALGEYEDDDVGDFSLDDL